MKTRYLSLTSVLFVVLYSLCCSSSIIAQKTKKEDIQQMLEKWHKAASEADFSAYFDLMTKSSVFIGTDATENWTYDDFKAFAKPYFDKGIAWSFNTLERNVFVHKNGETAWFDELLNTQMGICRGSGVVLLDQEEWKIQHYVLSIAIPNENVKEITALKKKFDTELINKLDTKNQ